MSSQPSYPLMRTYLGDPLSPLRRDWPILSQTVEGAAKGFFLYLVPFTLVRRQIDSFQLRRAAACGVFVGSMRAAHTLLVLAAHHLQPDTEAARAARAASRTQAESALGPKLKRVQDMVQLEQPDGFYLIRSVLRFPRMVAAVIATLLAYGVDPSLGNQLFVIWCLIRALRVIAPNGGDTAMLCLSSGQILSSLVYVPEYVNPSYLKFLYVHGGFGKKAVDKWMATRPHDRFCGAMHQHTKSCYTHLTTFPLLEMKNAARVYAPLYLVFFIFGRNKDPARFLANIIRSSLFLTCYTSIAHLSQCGGFRVVPGATRTKLALFTSLSGIAGLIERPSRRVELASYCLTYALDELVTELISRRIIPRVSYARPIVLALSAAVLMQRHEQQMPFFTKWLCGLP